MNRLVIFKNSLLSQACKAYPIAFNGLNRSFTSKATYNEATGMIKSRHKSNAETLISKFPVVEMEAMTVVCDGGGGSLGHPIEYMNLDTIIPYTPVTCKYCGTKFVMKKDFH